MEPPSSSLQQQMQPATTSTSAPLSATAPVVAPAASKTLVELSLDGQQQLDTVVESAHDILLSLNRALSSPGFWVAPSLQQPQQQQQQQQGAGNGGGKNVNGEGGGEGESGEKGGGVVDGSAEGLAALDATRVRYKSATGALRATVAAIVKITQADGDAAAAAESVDTETDYLERRAADLREEVERKNMIVKVHVDQLRTLVADIFMWQTTGL